MISEQDKQAILKGEYGVTNDGLKVAYLGKSANVAYPYWFGILTKDDLITQVITCTEYLQELDGYGIAITGLWENRYKPFDIDKALKGEPVKLADGTKAYVLQTYVLHELKTDKTIHVLCGYRVDFGGDESPIQWTMTGRVAAVRAGYKNNCDIISMWD